MGSGGGEGRGAVGAKRGAARWQEDAEEGGARARSAGSGRAARGQQRQLQLLLLLQAGSEIYSKLFCHRPFGATHGSLRIRVYDYSDFDDV